MFQKPEIHATRRHGFRFSLADALVLAGGIGLSVWLCQIEFPLWWIAPVVVGHFFLFCNVFLVWQRLELAWAALFVANILIHAEIGKTGWFSPLAVQSPITIVIILLQLCSPHYHGIFARQINSRLDDFLNGTL